MYTDLLQLKGVFACSDWISVTKSAKLRKSATEKHDKKASFIFGRDLPPKACEKDSATESKHFLTATGCSHVRDKNFPQNSGCEHANAPNEPQILFSLRILGISSSGFTS